MANINENNNNNADVRSCPKYGPPPGTLQETGLN